MGLFARAHFFPPALTGSNYITHARYAVCGRVSRMRSAERRLAPCVCHIVTETAKNKNTKKNTSRDAAEDISHHRLDFIRTVKTSMI